MAELEATASALGRLDPIVGGACVIARSLELSDLMDELAKERPLFHSEADFQLAFGLAAHDMAPDVNVRLEVRQTKGEYLDLLCIRGSARTAIEFKYFTRSFTYDDPRTREEFRLKSHAADDLARLHFVTDIQRLERCRDTTPGTNGLAIMLTNHAGLWSEPRGKRPTRDRNFRIHEGRSIGGELRWGNGDCPKNDRYLAGDYQLSWRDYGEGLNQNPGGEFRWLCVEVTGR